MFPSEPIIWLQQYAIYEIKHSNIIHWYISSSHFVCTPQQNSVEFMYTVSDKKLIP